MKKHSKLLSAILAAVMLLALAAVAAFVWPGFLVSKTSEIDGRWVDDAYGTVINFDNGKYFDSLLTCTYEIDGDVLTLDFGDGLTREYHFELDGDTLTIYNGSVVHSYTRWKRGEEKPTQLTSIYGESYKKFAGKWLGDKDNSFVFNEDGTGVYRDYGSERDFTYIVKDGNHIVITCTSGVSSSIVNYIYWFDGDTLNIRDDFGAQASFRREGAENKMEE
ncbi:MAG: hypothetical protein IKZ81_04375 [Clostridia bacterium]|nr:hypothetical protein [Clostridia bacterium]MBR5942559.1 hypothetical protein [Clostridia bacterium]